MAEQALEAEKETNAVLLSKLEHLKTLHESAKSSALKTETLIREYVEKGGIGLPAAAPFVEERKREPQGHSDDQGSTRAGQHKRPAPAPRSQQLLFRIAELERLLAQQ